MNSKLLVSVIMPLYNAQIYVAEAIKSVQDQTYTHWELIIVNDGSTDNSLEVVKAFESEKISVYTQENKGASAARNYGYRKSKGLYIKFFDADDLLSSNMIEEQAKRLIENENGIASAQWGRFYNDDIATFKLSPEECWQDMNAIDWICSSWKNAQSMTQPGIFLIPRTTIEKAGLWDERLSLIDDLEYFTKTILHSEKVVFSNECILYYRTHAHKKSLASSFSISSAESALRALEMATTCILKKETSIRTKRICANSFQSIIYSFYPEFAEITHKAENRVKELGGSDLVYKNGFFYSILTKILGWKMTSRIKSFEKQIHGNR